MTDSGGTGAVIDINLTFDDAAPAALPDEGPLTSGTYKPGQGTTPASQNCAAPGSFPKDVTGTDPPAGPYGSSLSEFNGTNPTGDWKLYVIDDTAVDAGSIDSWSLDISTTPVVPMTKADCKKGGWKDFGWPDQGTCISAVNQNRP